MNNITELISKLGDNWDVILLSGTKEIRTNLEEINGGYIADKAYNSLTTSGYIVNSNYYDNLLTNYLESKTKLESGLKQEDYAINVYCNILSYIFNIFKFRCHTREPRNRCVVN
jgi:hypothetical protein